jgi:preprotein translocase subunit SecA
MRIFGGDRMKGLMTRLNLPDDMPIQAGILTRSIGQAQSKVEGRNFDARKHLLEYDDVLNKQRLAIYRRRQEMIESGVVKRTQKSEVEGEAETEVVSKVPLGPALAMLDTLWMGHLENMDALQESVRLRSVGQHDPLIEYRREGRMLYQDMLAAFDQWLIENEDRFTVQTADQSMNPAPKFNLPSIPDIGQGM